jgi:hypothetical protein
VARMAINPGIPIPSAMPRVSLERPFNGTDDGVDEDVGDCTVEVGLGPQLVSKWAWGTETINGAVGDPLDPTGGVRIS